MADKFSEWFIPQMDKIGYEQAYIDIKRTSTVIAFEHKPTGLKFNTVYVKHHTIELDILRGFFEASNEPFLFIVDSDLVTELTVNDKWLRAIHALYFGRIYVWDGKGILAIHHNKQTGTLHSNGLIDVSVLVFDKVDCWYPGFLGVFYIARFDDRTFWAIGDNPKYAKTEKPPKNTAQQEYEDFWKQNYTEFMRNYGFNYSTAKDTPPNYRNGGAGTGFHDHTQQSKEDVFRDFREAFERNKRQYGGNPYYPSPRSAPTGDKWLTMLLAEGTLAGAKKKFRELAHEYHPDKAGDSAENIQAMQMINAAWARAKEILA